MFFSKKILKILAIAIIALFLALLIRYFVFQTFSVKGTSMEPNFVDGEYLIIDKLSYLLRKPKRGEAVIIAFSQKDLFFKRVVGLPEETLEIKNGDIFIYNKKQNQWIKVSEKYLLKNTKTSPDFRVVLKKNEYFVIGDNRQISFDSRAWGAIPLKYIVGKTLIRVWPLTFY